MTHSRSHRIHRQPLIQILIAVDQLINTLLPAPLEGFGFADETISARAWRLRDSKNSFFWRHLHLIVDVLFFFDENHCYNSYLDEFDRQQLPLYYTNNQLNQHKDSSE